MEDRRKGSYHTRTKASLEKGDEGCSVASKGIRWRENGFGKWVGKQNDWTWPESRLSVHELATTDLRYQASFGSKLRIRHGGAEVVSLEELGSTRQISKMPGLRQSEVFYALPHERLRLYADYAFDYISREKIHVPISLFFSFGAGDYLQDGWNHIQPCNSSLLSDLSWRFWTSYCESTTLRGKFSHTRACFLSESLTCMTHTTGDSCSCSP